MKLLLNVTLSTISTFNNPGVDADHTRCTDEDQRVLRVASSPLGRLQLRERHQVREHTVRAEDEEGEDGEDMGHQAHAYSQRYGRNNATNYRCIAIVDMAMQY